MTTARKPAPAGPDAVKALLDVITGGNGTIEVAHPVTLPGRPVTVHLSAEEVAAYLKATGWKERRGYPSAVWHASFVRRGEAPVFVPNTNGSGDPSVLFGLLDTVAHHEGRHPLDVAEAIIARRNGSKAKGRKGSK